MPTALKNNLANNKGWTGSGTNITTGNKTCALSCSAAGVCQ
jgi:hypothetical protein